MKRKRHLMILKIISENPVSTQEELMKLLFENGFDVTQATVSRDIKELKLIKTTDSEGRYCYSVPEAKQNESSENFNSLLFSSVSDVRYAFNMVCVLCHSGSAQAVCFAIDEMKNEHIIGTIAGDDTIFVMCQSQSEAQEVCKLIKNLAKKD